MVWGLHFILSLRVLSRVVLRYYIFLTSQPYTFNGSVGAVFQLNLFNIMDLISFYNVRVIEMRDVAGKEWRVSVSSPVNQLINMSGIFDALMGSGRIPTAYDVDWLDVHLRADAGVSPSIEMVFGLRRP